MSYLKVFKSYTRQVFETNHHVFTRIETSRHLGHRLGLMNEKVP